MSETLPKGWAIAKLGEIIQVHSGDGLTKKNMASGGTVPVYGGNGITGYHDKWNVNKKTIVVGRVGYYCGSVHLTPDHAWVTDNAFITHFSESNIDNKFLYYLLTSADLRSNDSSTAQPVISGKKIYPIKIILPPYFEQKRIAEKLDCLLTKVDACKTRLDKVPEIIKRFRQSVLADAVSGKLTEDWREKWKNESNGNLNISKKIELEWEKSYQESIEEASKCGKRKPKKPKLPEIQKPNGLLVPKRWELVLSYYLFTFVTSGSRGWAKYYSDKGPLFLRIGNLNRDSIFLDLKSTKRVNPPLNSEGVRTRVQTKDILISITADTGIVALVDSDLGEAYINQHIALARPLKVFSIKYLSYALASQIGQNQFKNLQRGMTKTGLGLDDIRSIWVPMPEIDEQKEIVRRVEALHEVADQLENKLEISRSKVGKLTSSILSKAFRGELVPQDPTDEPAELLLNRIRSERVGLAATKKKGGRTAKKKSRQGKKTKSQKADAEPEPATVHLKTGIDEEKDRKVKKNS